MDDLASARGQTVCKFFNSPRGCMRGGACGFMHTQSHEKPPCRFYGTSQGCRFGEGCRFSHTQTSMQPTVYSTSRGGGHTSGPVYRGRGGYQHRGGRGGAHSATRIQYGVTNEESGPAGQPLQGQVIDYDLNSQGEAQTGPEGMQMDYE